MRNFLLAFLAAVLVCTGLSAPAHGSTGRVLARPGAASYAASATPKREVAFSKAKTQAGDPYRYGGNGPSSWDCSGLVYWAYAKAGISLPRTSGAQRSSSKTYHVSRYKAKRGDLVFWGYGHVEFLSKVYKKAGRWYTETFGAHHSGTRVSYRTSSGVPHFEHVRNSG